MYNILLILANATLINLLEAIQLRYVLSIKHN